MLVIRLGVRLAKRRFGPQGPPGATGESQPPRPPGPVGPEYHSLLRAMWRSAIPTRRARSRPITPHAYLHKISIVLKPGLTSLGYIASNFGLKSISYSI